MSPTGRREDRKISEVFASAGGGLGIDLDGSPRMPSTAWRSSQLASLAGTIVSRLPASVMGTPYRCFDRLTGGRGRYSLQQKVRGGRLELERASRGGTLMCRLRYRLAAASRIMPIVLALVL